MRSLFEYSTLDKNVQKEWGICDAIFINRKKLWTGPPPSYKKIRGMIEKQVRKN
jgi:hypothetical protein